MINFLRSSSGESAESAKQSTKVQRISYYIALLSILLLRSADNNVSAEEKREKKPPTNMELVEKLKHDNHYSRESARAELIRRGKELIDEHGLELPQSFLDTIDPTDADIHKYDIDLKMRLGSIDSILAEYAKMKLEEKRKLAREKNLEQLDSIMKFTLSGYAFSFVRKNAVPMAKDAYKVTTDVGKIIGDEIIEPFKK